MTRVLLRADLQLRALACAAGGLLFFQPFVLAALALAPTRPAWTALVDATAQGLDSYFVDDLHDLLRRSIAVPRPLGVATLILLAAAVLLVALSLRSALTRLRPAPATSPLRAIVALPALVLVVASLALTPLSDETVRFWTGSRTGPAAAPILFALQIAALACSCTAAWCAYHLAPAGPRAAAGWATALLAGLGLESLKYAAFLTWRPLVQEWLRGQYGPFHNAIGLLLFGHLGVLVLLMVRARAEEPSGE